MASVFTAPLAVIMIENKKVGKIKNLSFTENTQRVDVKGLGELTLQEIPAVGISCSFSASSYSINMKTFGSIDDPFNPMTAGSMTDYLRTVLLGEKPVSIHVYRRTAGSVNGNGIVTSEGNYEEIAIAKNCYLNSKSWEISENNAAGKNISGVYLEPILPILV